MLLVHRVLDQLEPQDRLAVPAVLQEPQDHRVFKAILEEPLVLLAHWVPQDRVEPLVSPVRLVPQELPV